MIQVTYLHWTAFAIFLIIMLVLDLGVFNRKKHVVSVKEALITSAIWIALAIVFNIGIFYFAGKEKGLEFLTGYLLEKSLSVDNIFVFILLFTYFAVPSVYQHKVLFWGIIGALIMRAILIALGAALVTKFHWVLYIFGIFLVITGFKMFFSKDEKVKPEKNFVVKLFKKYFPIKPGYAGGKFFVKENKKKYATTLFIVLLVIETTDLVFAFDSIPAILSITQDPFIVFTSNAFAILGLRALYFALANFLDKFHYLKHGLAIVLAFIGIKMLIVELYHFSIGLSLTIVASVIFISILFSLINKKK